MRVASSLRLPQLLQAIIVLLSPACALEDVFQAAFTSGSGLAATVYYYDGSFGTWPASHKGVRDKER
jgi:hypothetical protein